MFEADYKFQDLTGGSVYVDSGENIFCKRLPKPRYNKELKGYNNVRSFYPVPVLKKTFQDKNNGYLVYEYERTIGKDFGLLAGAYFAILDPDGNKIGFIQPPAKQ